MELFFVLVEPAVPENIGAAARAIKTMGFKNLRLVNPCDHLQDQARWLAHASNEILEQAELFPDFNAAVADMDLVIASTAKRRRVNEDYYPVHELPTILENKKHTATRVAIVFGREERGLDNPELKRCDILTTVPMKTVYPSINLAQSVMIYTYTLSALHLEPQQTAQTAHFPALQALKGKVGNALQELGFREDSAIYHRFFERLMAMNDTDIHLLHSICNKFETYQQSDPKTE